MRLRLARHAKYSIVENYPDRIVIRDEHNGHQLTVTNDAEHVVSELSDILGARRLFYWDTQGDFDELLHDGHGAFKGFRPGPKRKVSE